MKHTLTLILNCMAAMSPGFRAILALGAVIVAVVDYVNSLWAELFAKIDALVMPVLGEGANFSALGFVNYVFPLDTVLTMVLAYGALRLVCAGIRIIKSFIPSIA